MSRSLLDALRLVFIVDAATAADGDRIDATLGAGVGALWLRAPEESGAELYRRARDLRVRCEAHGAALIVGDRADVALAVGAGGVQLGHRSPPASRVRPWFPGWLGVSCHSEREVLRATQAGADYIVLSPLFGVPEKGPPLGPERFRRLRAGFAGPVVALGGVEVDNASRAREADADGVAVIRALRDAEDPAAATRMLLSAVTAS